MPELLMVEVDGVRYRPEDAPPVTTDTDVKLNEAPEPANKAGKVPANK